MLQTVHCHLANKSNAHGGESLMWEWSIFYIAACRWHSHLWWIEIKNNPRYNTSPYTCKHTYTNNIRKCFEITQKSQSSEICTFAFMQITYVKKIWP